MPGVEKKRQPGDGTPPVFWMLLGLVLFFSTALAAMTFHFLKRARTPESAADGMEHAEPSQTVATADRGSCPLHIHELKNCRRRL